MKEFRFYNKNPQKNTVGDCVVRAIATATNKSWEETYIGLCAEGLLLFDMPTANSVWSEYLRRNGFKRSLTEHGETVRSFCERHPSGDYILACDGHVVAVMSGNYIDTWDSGDEAVIYYWHRG